ncbi:MAG: hypothetical protein KME16_11915 [Scytolyngbya sp. HA4215-MV1]|jgi:uncharacterized protein involved in exopolysaccharide biosynthesis|nr:hypothetical protein [Scytolyngbya sp. HA4215-MV1]
MTEYPTALKSEPKSSIDSGRILRYVVLGVAANVLVWAFALIFLKAKTPIYTSEWTLTIPTGGNTTNVNLPGLGSATEQSRAPFANSNSFDPREIYKMIISSDSVQAAATARLNEPNLKVGKPRVEIVDNSTVMSLSITGETGELARKKAIAVTDAFQARLNDLRLQEANRRESAMQTVIESAKKKLDLAQARLSDYKARSGLVANDQIVQLSNNIEGLRRTQIETLAAQSQSNARFSQLSSSLDVSPNQASEAFILKADPLFQQYLASFSDSSNRLVELNSKFGPNHPLVVREKATREAAESALLRRSQTLIGRPVSQVVLARLNLGGGAVASAREDLFKTLVREQVDRQGFSAQAQELEHQINQLQARLAVLAKQGATLDALTRDMQVAETVFSSTIARFDVGKLDAFGSYPAIQILEEPTQPDSPSDPNKKLILLGATLCSFFITSALISAWTRKQWMSKLTRMTSPQPAPEVAPTYVSDAPALPSETKPELLDLSSQQH